MFNYKPFIAIIVIYFSNTYTYGNNIKQEADFDTSFLMGSSKHNIDISQFKYGNPILAGNYDLDLYINNKWIGKRNFYFSSKVKQENATTCFTEDMLLAYHVKKSILQNISNPNGNLCAPLSKWVKDAYYEFDNSNQKLYVFIPQIALDLKARDYVDPQLWDSGVNAGFISYNINTYQTSSNTFSQKHSSLNAFMGLVTGINLGKWQLRHNSQWQWNNKNAIYTPINTYIQRPISQYQSQLTVGDSFTSGNIFESIGYRGIDLSSDDRMLPNSMSGYAPQIHGIAKTNAKVEIRQRGQLIYQTMVPPGAFEINDLYPTGFGSTLDVAIIEQDGYIQKFSVPYSSSIQMLRPNRKKFSITLGQVREKLIDAQPNFTQATYQYGLNNLLTASTGTQISDKYYTLSLGTALSTSFGAISFDIIHSHSIFQDRAFSGQVLSLNYNKVLEPVDTQINLSLSQPLNGSYFSLKDALYTRNQPKYLASNMLSNQQQQLQISLSQILPKQLGSFYLTGAWTKYNSDRSSNNQYQFGYSNNYKNMSYSFSMISQQVQYINQKLGHNMQYLFTISFPFNFNKQLISTTASFSADSQTIGALGNIGNNLNYSTTLTSQAHQKNYSINANYKTDIATFSSSYSQSNTYKQTALNLGGSLVFHKHGVLFSPDQGQTMAIVYAPNATGAQINNNPNIFINKSGYALIPYLTPYRINEISINPQYMSNHIELKETSYNVAPYAGAISQIIFATQEGYAIYIHSKMTNNQPLPFAAQAYNSKGEIIGIVAQGSLVYIRTPFTKDIITIKWGNQTTEQCKINYALNDKIKSNQNMSMLELPCH